ncbi:MAG: hypothetical protein HY243_14630 [Proteobacteria bacterium]|nr:hypothetical protein [Pseudomonadota bacterium]
MFWAMAGYVALMLVPAILVMLILRKTVEEMAGPYLAFAVMGPVFLLVVLALWTWEDRGASPKPLTLAWCLCMALFMLTAFAATAYSGVALHIIGAQDRNEFFVVSGVGGVTAALVVVPMFYRRILTTVAARAAKRARKLAT